MDMRYGDLVLNIPEGVYEPAEDSIMLADAAGELQGEILEIGCGCGIASLACAKKHPENTVTSVDINPYAVECASQNARSNGIRNATFIRSDLFSAVGKREFDAVLFNPPYLPTEKSEKLPGRINDAFDGGPDGRRVLDRFLKEFDSHLKPHGILLLIQSSLNDPEKTTAALEAQEYIVSTESRQDFFFEKLFLIKAIRK